MTDITDVNVRVTGDQMLTSLEHETVCIAVDHFLLNLTGQFKWNMGAVKALSSGLDKLQAAKRLAIAEAGDADAS